MFTYVTRVTLLVFLLNQTLCHINEWLVYIVACLRTCHDDWNLLSRLEILNILLRNLNLFARLIYSLLIVKQIALIRKNENQDIITDILMDFLEPAIDWEEWLPIRDIKHYYNTISALVICICNCAVAFLTCGVPNLQFCCCLVNLKSTESLIN